MKYFLNKNFSIIEYQDNELIHTIDSIQEDDKKKDITLYLNKTAAFILTELLKGEQINQIEIKIKETFTFQDEQTINDLQKIIINTICKLEKIGIIVSNEI